MNKNGLMLHTQRGIQHHNVGGVGHFSIDNGQEKTKTLLGCDFVGGIADGKQQF